MSRKIFVNLAVNDVKKTIAFFEKLGFAFNPQFTNADAACMIVSEEAFVMLLSQNHFKGFTKKQIADSTKQTEAILAVSAESRAEVDSLVKKAFAAGGKPANDPMDHGFMYGWSFQDLDGHLWEVVWMDPSAIQK
ncbi:MAG: VOC family protein [Polyangiales bacterium]